MSWNSGTPLRENSMSAQSFDDIDEKTTDSTDPQDSTNNASPSTKLERRRRIEELDEERLLRKELSEYY